MPNTQLPNGLCTPPGSPSSVYYTPDTSFNIPNASPNAAIPQLVQPSTPSPTRRVLPTLPEWLLGTPHRARQSPGTHYQNVHGHRSGGRSHINTANAPNMTHSHDSNDHNTQLHNNQQTGTQLPPALPLPTLAMNLSRPMDIPPDMAVRRCQGSLHMVNRGRPCVPEFVRQMWGGRNVACTHCRRPLGEWRDAGVVDPAGPWVWPALNLPTDAEAAGLVVDEPVAVRESAAAADDQVADGEAGEVVMVGQLPTAQPAIDGQLVLPSIASIVCVRY